MPHLYDYPLAVVDVETTGTSYLRGGIIDIGVFRIENGQVVQTYQRLLNPGSVIPAFITQLTGITNEDLSSAPAFADIANDLEDILADCIFVAHNARFDYAFVKEEFKRAGIRYAPKTFCTVKLSRMLYPQHRHHKLDSLIERFSISIDARHRAFGDAMATWQAMDCMVQQADPQLLEYIVKQQLRQPALPPQLPKQLVDQLPDSPGVYIFENASGGVLYVGKSINIKSRVLSHFSDDVRSVKELTLSQEVANIRTITTAGELGALLKESELIKTLMPVYNRALRRKTDLVLAIRQTSPQGYPTVKTQRYRQADIGQIDQVMAVFRSEREAKESLTSIAKEYQLCHKYLGLEKTSSACFAHHLNTCRGACVGKETPLSYELRFNQAFAGVRLQRWPYPGPVMITEQGAEGSSTSFIIDQWSVIASLDHRDQDTQTNSFNQAFDLDQYKILRRFLGQPTNNAVVKTLQPIEAEEIINRENVWPS